MSTTDSNSKSEILYRLCMCVRVCNVPIMPTAHAVGPAGNRKKKGLIQVAQGKLHCSKAFDLPTHANNPTPDPIDTNSKIYKLSFVFCRDLHLSGGQMRVFLCNIKMCMRCWGFLFFVIYASSSQKCVICKCEIGACPATSKTQQHRQRRSLNVT